MDGLTELIQKLEAAGQFAKHLPGCFHILIGRRLTLADNTIISNGITWRTLASLLTNCRIDPEYVRQLGVDPEELSPRERPRFWYSAIALAKPDGVLARSDADSVIPSLRALGYFVGPAPAASTTLSTSLPANVKKTRGTEAEEPASKKKKPR